MNKSNDFYLTFMSLNYTIYLAKVNKDTYYKRYGDKTKGLRFWDLVEELDLKVILSDFSNAKSLISNEQYENLVSTADLISREERGLIKCQYLQ